MSAAANAEAEGVVSKVKVKKEIKTIVENLETILGDLKDVAKELKEVVHEIDTLTCDLQLEEDGMTDSSKTDTLNSSSSSTTTTASSLEKMKLFPEDSIFKKPSSIIPVPVNPSAVLAVFKRSHPPLPPPRLTPLRTEEPMPLLRHEKNKCPEGPGREPRERERVRFSEKVQYHGYCPDCDLQYDVDNMEFHLQTELNALRLSPVHCCSSSSPPPPRALSHDLLFPPTKTILRKSTTTTV
uniref:Proline rich 16 n=1 Tax=Cynoglossus semilaevis TaxID=244447 RepID=A0A3P8WVQ4_CYNSE